MDHAETTIKWSEPTTFHSDASALIKPASVVMDIGCGLRPQQYVIPETLICVEPHREYADLLRRNLAHTNAIIIQLEALTALSALPDRSVDSIFLIDVIEHMPKEIGQQVLDQAQRVARQQIVLFTPLGYMPQEVQSGNLDGWNLHGGERQQHKSGWYPEDFQGWNIVACATLHSSDHEGNPITPPYGALYAVKDIKKDADLFNDIYTKSVLDHATSELSHLEALFPRFSELVVKHDIERGLMGCGIRSCRRMTELFIQVGAEKSEDEILKIVASERTTDLIDSSRIHVNRIREFSNNFAAAGVREEGLTGRATHLTTREEDLKRREAEVAARAIELATRSTALDARDAELTARRAAQDAQDAELAKRETHLRRGLCARTMRLFGK